MNPFFIVGNQRSGTTLLSVVLSKHSEVYLDGFAKVFRLMACFEQFADLISKNTHHSKEKILKWLIENDYKGRLVEFLDIENLEKYETIRELIQQGIDNQLKQNNKKYWGDKAPNLQFYLPNILTLTPDAKFIHIVRDGRATAFSESQRAYKNIYLSAQTWVEGQALALSHQAVLGKGKYHIIRYEDLLEEPEKTVKSVCQFLEIPFEENMLDLSDKNAGKSYVKSKFDTSKINTYQKELPVKTIRKIEQIEGSLLQKFGYNLLYANEKDFKQLSIWKRLWYSQKDNFRQLFRSKKTGMYNREIVEREVSLKKRLGGFALRFGRDFMSKRLFKGIFEKTKKLK